MLCPKLRSTFRLLGISIYPMDLEDSNSLQRERECPLFYKILITLSSGMTKEYTLREPLRSFFKVVDSIWMRTVGNVIS